jgi:hypothetical protein
MLALQSAALGDVFFKMMIIYVPVSLLGPKIIQTKHASDTTDFYTWRCGCMEAFAKSPNGGIRQRIHTYIEFFIVELSQRTINVFSATGRNSPARIFGES